MQLTINLPDQFTEKIGDQWGDLQQKIITNLVLNALKEGLINFDEFKEMLNFFSDAELKKFLEQNNMFHSRGILNLSGTCPDLEFVEDELDIYDDIDETLIEVIDEQ